MDENRVLIADFNPSAPWASELDAILNRHIGSRALIRREAYPHFPPLSAAASLKRMLEEFGPRLTLLVLPSGDGDSLASLATLFHACNLGLMPTLAIMDTDQTGILSDLLALGVGDFITPPFKAAEVIARVTHALRPAVEETVIQSLKGKLGIRQMIGRSPLFLEEMEKIPMVARCDASVLILGETGTGKELCARAVHYLSPRSDKPFVAVNCGAIPLDLVENELFGHEKEAYTGASGCKRGLVQEADGGTLFLDEVDSLPLAAQVKLLRFLQEKEFRPLGSTRTQKAEVRVLAATNLEGRALIESGKLRNDLYYRLNVVSLSMPPLRRRKEDIPLLLEFFLGKHASRLGREVDGFMPKAVQKLLLHSWPGNIRELEHVVERAIILSRERIISDREIILPGDGAHQDSPSFQEAKDRIINEFEKTYLTSLLLSCRGNISQAAINAGKHRRAFFQLMQKHGIDANGFRPVPI